MESKKRILAVIGNPIAHSKSPLIHNAALEKLKLPFTYTSFRVDNLEEAIIEMKKSNYAGYSVTIPHKVEAMKYVDVISPEAKIIGAINTIVNKKGKLFGYNTDCAGAINALKTKTTLKGKKVYVLGNGGAARAIVAGLIQEKAKVTIFGREKERLEKFSKEFGCEYKLNPQIDDKCDILINATSVGMHPDINDSPIDTKILNKKIIVFDIVYNPLETLLLKEAKKKGCKTIQGIEMFLGQAFEQFKLFTGKKAPEELMRKTLLEVLQKEGQN